MSLETASYISGLNPLNPLGTDPIAFTDDHIRLLKVVLQSTFPNLDGPVTVTPADLNDLLRKAGGTLTGPLVLAGDPSAALHPATKQWVDAAIAALTTSLGGKAASTVQVSAGAGLTGGGDLSANRSLALTNTGVTAGSYGDADHNATFAVDAQGRLTAAAAVARARDSYTLASASGAAVNRTVYLTPGTWQVILDTRAVRTLDGNFDVTVTQQATVDTATVNTNFRLWRSGDGGHGRPEFGSDVAVGTLTVTAAGDVSMSMAAAVGAGVDLVGSILTIERM